MKFLYKNPKIAGEFRLTLKEPEFDRLFFGKDGKDKFMTIAWNKGEQQSVTVDNMKHDFPKDALLCLIVNQSFTFSNPSDIISWQFNREFYCLIDHDREVSCVGFLFGGSPQQAMFISLDDNENRKIDLLTQIFMDEFQTIDNIQEDMLRMLLKRLIIITTRLAKQQYLGGKELTDQKLNIIRQFNLLVENHYKAQHSVKFYADQINRSPKTLSNLFAIYNEKSPLAVIQDRILLEAKRLLIYTDKSVKEIGYDLGFEEAAHFSTFFKNNAEVSPSEFRNGQFIT